jgi:hypothetical protein
MAGGEPEGQDPGRAWGPFGTLAKMALIAAAIGLAATAYVSLGREAQAVLVTVFCALGLIGTAVMLIILVRQSNGGR